MSPRNRRFGTSSQQARRASQAARLASLALLLAVAASCSDASAPTRPDSTPPLGSQVGDPPVPVDSLVVVPDTVELVRWEEAVLQAKAFDADGNEITKFKVDEWIVSEPDSLELRKLNRDDAAVVTALASTPITVQVVAVAGDAADTATVRIIPLRDRVVVVDSTVLYLVSTEEELAAGVYRFQVDPAAGPVPAIEVDDVIAGDQGDTFLRRVTAVVSQDPLVLETGEADLDEVFVKGATAKGKIPGIRGGPNGRQHLPRGKGERGVEWGDDEEMVQAGMPDIFGFPEGLDLCAGVETDSTRVDAGLKACAEVAVTGSVDATFDVDVDLKVSATDPEFFLGVEGGIDFVIDYEATLSLIGEVTLDRALWTPWVRVTLLGIPGRLRVGTVPGVTLTGTGEFTVIHGFDGHLYAEAGVDYDEGWGSFADADWDFNWHDPAYKASGEVELLLFFEKRAELKWAGTTTTVSRGPFGRVTVTADDIPFPHGELRWPPVHASADVGYAVGLNTKVEILKLVELSYTWREELLTYPIFDWWGQGGVEVQVTTTGVDPDPSGYTVRMARETPGDDPEWRRVLARQVESNGTVLLEREPANRSCMRFFGGSWSNCDMANLRHQFTLDDVMWNCEVTTPQPVAMQVYPFTEVGASAEVTCESVFVSLARTIDEMLADGRITNAGVANALRRHLAAADDARTRGSPGAAHNVMDAFLNLVDAASKMEPPNRSVRIEPGAAALLTERAREIQEGYIGS